VLRRVIAAALLIVGVCAVAFVPDGLYVVEPVDWSAEYAKANTTTPIAQYVNERLSTSSQITNDPAWAAMYDVAASTCKSTCKVYAHDDPMLKGNAGIVVYQNGAERKYLRVSHRGVAEAPLSLMRPYLYYGIPLILLSLVVYWLLRWKLTRTPVHYQVWMTTLIDVFGFVFAGLAGLVVVQAAQRSWSNAASAGLSALGISLVMILPTAYFASKRVVLLEDRVRVLTLFGHTDFPFTRIFSYVRRERQAPIVGILLIVLGITNLVSAVLGIALLVRKDPRFTLERDDGKKFKIWVRTSSGLELLTQKLAENGVVYEWR
jgi:hypothetical protein